MRKMETESVSPFFGGSLEDSALYKFYQVTNVYVM